MITILILFSSFIVGIYLQIKSGEQLEKMSFTVQQEKTEPIDGQKTGTSGLRKQVKVFESKNYVENFLESLFLAIDEGDSKLAGSTLVVGGDGRYFNKYGEINYNIYIDIKNNCF